MKKLLLLLLFAIPSFCNAQVSANNLISTTQEEYNYLTRGLKIQKESGLDVKAGYEITKIGTRKVGNYSFEYSYLVKNDIKKTVAISLIATSNVSGITYYFAIPYNNINLLQNYYSAVASLDENMTTAIAISVSEMLANTVLILQSK